MQTTTRPQVHTTTVQADADAAGDAELAVPPSGTVPAGELWLVERVNIYTDQDAAAADPTFTLHVGSRADTPSRRDGTTAGRLNASEFVHPLVAADGERIFGVFAGAEPGARCYMTIQIAKVAR